MTTLTIPDLLNIETLMRNAKEHGASSSMTLKIAQVERLIEFAKEKFGIEQVEEARKAGNLVQFKKETSKMRTFRSWQDEQQRAERERQQKKARADRNREKERKKRQEEQLQILARNFAGDLKTLKSA